MTHTPILFALAALLIVSGSDLRAQTTPDTSSSVETILPRYDASRLAGLVKYPELARNNNISGTVHVKFLVDEQGRTSRIEVVETSSPILSKAAVDAVSKMTFAPARRLGKPVSCWMTIPVQFSLVDGSESDSPASSLPIRSLEEIARLPADPSGRIWDASQLRAADLPRYHAPGLTATIRYPEDARKAGRQGTVVISTIIDADGRVVEPEILLSTDPLLDAAALDAVSRYAFVPGSREEKRVRVRLAIPVDFTLPK